MPRHQKRSGVSGGLVSSTGMTDIASAPPPHLAPGSTRSAQEELAAFQLALAKAEARGKAELPEYLKRSTELEEVTEAIANRIAAVGSNTAEAAHLRAICGTDSVLGQAQFLANIQMKKVAGERLLARYGAARSEIDGAYDERENKQTTAFQGRARNATTNAPLPASNAGATATRT
jgi:hypothetical protein